MTFKTKYPTIRVDPTLKVLDFNLKFLFGGERKHPTIRSAITLYYPNSMCQRTFENFD